MPFSLTRDAWKTFKSDNDLSKSSFFKKADVGPTIDAFWKAAEDFSRAKTTDTVRRLFTKAGDLEKAFGKFITLKEAKDELKPAAKGKIEAWKNEVNATAKALAEIAGKYKDDLAENQKQVLLSRLKASGIIG